MSLPPTPQQLDEEHKETELVRPESLPSTALREETLIVGSARDCDVTIKDISISPDT